ncbi:MAG: DUF1365 domain-containing protein [Rhodocyclaceae bacterium]|nr:DUF1365 domain-containing protein [Rhodocyclaceae bacterium]MBP7081568.1 DUF1365 domain-containing protein [Rhodocyclaceae bacterium]
MHARFAGKHSPTAHQFTYPLFFVALPLSLLTSIKNRWFGLEQARPLSFHQRDHGARDGAALLPWIRQLLLEEGITNANGEIVLQTFPRVLGFVFNPVSFWFCHDREGALRAVLCDVRNTFGDRHNYLVVHDDQRPIQAIDHLPARKVFHVSPFFPIVGDYRFRFDISEQRRRVEIDYFIEGERVLATVLQGTPEALTASTARGALLRQPLLTLGVVFRIHWHALQLWLKRAVFHSRPTPPAQETTR